MLSKNQLKLLTSLRQKKYRLEHQLFLAEGLKVVNEFLLSNLELEVLYCTEDLADAFKEFSPEYVSDKELKKISNFSSPSKIVGVFKIPKPNIILHEGLIVGLDEINDPGNLGTIIRCCDWYGVKQIVCSENTVDCFNPKVVQASMGSLARIAIHYIDLENFIKQTELTVYAANMQGKSAYTIGLKKNACLVMGNEARGLSPSIKALVKEEITIPRYGDQTNTESLNVSIATAILLNEFRRAEFIEK